MLKDYFISLLFLSFIITIFKCEKIKFKSPKHPNIIKLEDCVVGDTFVINHLLYECHRWEILAKGYKIIGCVPSNHPNGTIIDIGQKYKDLFFNYNCSRNNNIVTFKATNCIFRNVSMAIGSKRQQGLIRNECLSDDNILYMKETRVLHDHCDRKIAVEDCPGIGEGIIYSKYGRGREVAFNVFNRKVIT
uniref:Ricin B-type lectin domain-containing protein n=1 Tax=Parastrongyloides trichosuri TaxID=131310 RepID=A0A0N4ZS09_PARTI